MLIGIYSIKNIVNGKVYVGQSVQISRRFSTHKSELKAGKHKNQALQQDHDQHGLEKFVFSVLEICDKAQLLEREDYWIKELNALDNRVGYNSILSDDQPATKLTPQQREEIKQIFINDESVNIEMVANQYNVGTTTIYNIRKELGIKPEKVITQAQRETISQKLKGRKLSNEHSENIRKAVKQSHGYSSYTEQQIKKVIDLLLKGLTNREIEAQTNVSYTVINNVRNKKSWTDLTEGLNIPNVKCKNQYSK